MVSVLCNRIDFTRLVEQALTCPSVQEHLKNVQNVVSTKRTIAVKALRSKLSKERHQQLSNLVILFKEQLDVLSDLLGTTKPVQVWANECRFYPRQDGKAVCKCGELEITLGDHFPARTMLVTTPLTRVVRRFYFQACMGKGYLWLHGPAGTGKTETAKDTAAMLGQDSCVMNCRDADWNVSKLTDELGTGTNTNAGPVVILDCFNCLAPDVQYACIAAVAKAGRFLVCTCNASPSMVLNQNCKFFALPMEVPCYEKIVQVMIGLEGIVACDTLGTAIYECMRACKANCSKQSWYDFGLRAFKAHAKRVGAWGRVKGFADETKLVCDTLGASLFSSATVADKSVVLAAVKKAFGRDSVIPKAWASGPTEHALPMMAQAISQTRHGVCVVGLTDVKAEACIAAIKETAGTETIVVQHHSTSGSLNNCRHPLVAAMRVGAQTTKPVIVCVKVALGCDGDTLAPLHTLLDDNKKLCLDTAEILALPPNVRIIIFAADCSTWSSATVSRLGMVCGKVPPPLEDWKSKYEEAEVRCAKLQSQLDNLHKGISDLAGI